MSPKITLRPAQESDLPALTKILIRSFPADPEWVYRYPYAEQYPEDHYDYTLQRNKDYFENTTRGAVRMNIAELTMPLSSSSDENASTQETASSETTRIPIGYAIWALPYSHGTVDGLPEQELRFPALPGERRDANQARVQAYFDVIIPSKKRLFDDVYGERQYHLFLLAVDPAYQGLGAGRALVGDGIETARRESVPIGLFATGPGGRRLYGRLGFREIEKIVVGPVEGESETLEFPAMLWDGRDGTS